MPLIVSCGKKSLHIIDSDSGEIKWSLTWADNTSIPEDEKSWLAWYNSGTDDIKAINNNQQFLVSSVCGMLAVIDRATQDVEIIGWAPGAHSIEAMPGSFIAAAISHHPSYPPGAPEITGDLFQLYDRNRPREILWQMDAYGAHGVRWDESQQILWALEYNTLHALTFDPQRAVCEIKNSWQLPTESGHDLSWFDNGTLMASTSSGVYLFNTATHEFTPHPQLGKCEKVKGISRHPVTGETVYCYPDPGETVHTSADLHFVNQVDKITVAPHAVYKPRWLIE